MWYMNFMLRYILAALCDIFAVTSILTDEYVEGVPMHGLDAGHI
jgi:hypothetical protein